ncbi:sensor histidine kinase [Roseomonas sp. GC11]|uniref:sensor histidine kinase n=1 Tax=Roseomonas sp. GC11 TaxID=2950546 RepID=UPI00210A7A01|nr:sensor histidine kinase [Roseomonas sp. GC11]MCQ4158974.1 sensor histidine kinase [Roseomonas sp. GC11]
MRAGPGSMGRAAAAPHAAPSVLPPAALPAPHEPRPAPRFRIHLLRLVVVALLPLVLLSGALALWTAQAQRAEVLRGMAQTAHALQIAIDRELRTGMVTLEALAGMPGLDALLEPGAPEEEGAAFQARASAMAERPPGAMRNFALIRLGPAGEPLEQVMSTFGPPGMRRTLPTRIEHPPRPGLPLPDAKTVWLEMIHGGRARVSDLYRNNQDQPWRFAITLPIEREGRPVALLIAALWPERITAILEEHRPPPGWHATVVDRGGIILARSSDTAAWLALPAPAPVRAFQGEPERREAVLFMPEAPTGASYAALRRLEQVPWALAYAAPAASVDGPRWRTLALAAAAGVLALGLAALAALVLGRRLGREVEGLGRDAAAVALSEAPPRPRPAAMVREVAEARASLHRVGQALHQRAGAKRESEARQALLMREVDHRAKNALAVALSLVRLAPRDVTPELFAATAEGRLAAMARAHSLLAQEAWEGAALRAVAEGELAAHAGRVVMEGPELRLEATAVQPLAMLLHELATNAAKYGALSQPEGKVCLAWEGLPDGGLRLRWAESGGPPLEGPPVRRNFGSRLVRQLAERQLGGRLTLEWPREGLRVTLRLPPRGAGPAAGPSGGMGGWPSHGPSHGPGQGPGQEPGQGPSHGPGGGIGGGWSPATGMARGEAGWGAAPRLLLLATSPALVRDMSALAAEGGLLLLGPVREPGEAQGWLSAGIAAAVMEVPGPAEPFFPLADRLTERGVPCIFIAGPGAAEALSGRAAAVLRPPCGRGEISAAIAAALARPAQA